MASPAAPISSADTYGSAQQERGKGKHRQPPYNADAERGVLGSALQDSQRVLDLCIQHKILSESFHIPGHQTIYEVMLDMHQEARAIDLLTLAERLGQANELERIGGQSYLEELEDATPTPAHAEYYIDIVHQKYLLRSMIGRATDVIDRCYEGAEEAGELLQHAEQSFFEISEAKRNDMRMWSDMVKKSMEDIETIYQTKKGITGIPTGFKDVDKLLLGLQAGDMVILAARPSMGKTSLAMNVVEHIATGYRSCGGYHDQPARPVGIFSLEMSGEQLVRRMVCCCAKVSSHRLAGGYLSAKYHGDLIQAADALIKAPIYLDDTPGLTALEVKSRARRMKSKYNIGAVVIDYLQLMHFPQYSREGRQRETAAISGAMKAMAKELELPVIVLSQLSRAPETRGGASIPKLSDLRDSGSIEQDADIVLLLRRPCKYREDPEHDKRELAILDIAKHRNGPTGEVRINFEEDYTRFMDRLERDIDEDGGAFPGAGGFDG